MVSLPLVIYSSMLLWCNLTKSRHSKTMIQSVLHASRVLYNPDISEAVEFRNRIGDMDVVVHQQINVMVHGNNNSLKDNFMCLYPKKSVHVLILTTEVCNLGDDDQKLDSVFDKDYVSQVVDLDECVESLGESSCVKMTHAKQILVDDFDDGIGVKDCVELKVVKLEDD